MPVSYEIIVLKDAREILRVSHGKTYYYFDDSFLSVLTSIGFCNVCSDFKEYELVADPSALERKTVVITGAPSSDAINGILDIRIRWYASRRSPGKCLTCGESDLIELSLEHSVFIPRLESDVSFDIIGIANNQVDLRFLDSEGNLINGDAAEILKNLFKKKRAY